VGDTAKLTVEADEGYGPHQDELVKPIPKENFPNDVPLQPGMVFQGTGPHGPVAIRVKAVEDDKVLADFNHPLAGERLHFEVTVAAVREATPEELHSLTHGHECSEDGCQGCGHH
jgi:FKBP-type peptidyl-prolyl cis-trans isomerase SlyD